MFSQQILERQNAKSFNLSVSGVRPAFHSHNANYEGLTFIREYAWKRPLPDISWTLVDPLIVVLLTAHGFWSLSANSPRRAAPSVPIASTVIEPFELFTTLKGQQSSESQGTGGPPWSFVQSRRWEKEFKNEGLCLNLGNEWRGLRGYDGWERKF